MELMPIHLPESIKPLPIGAVLSEHESGMSYLCRLLFRNGLSLAMYRGIAGADYRTTPDSQHANLIGYLGGADTAALRARLPLAQTIAGKKFHWLGGHRLSNYGHLRGKHPQICVPCLRTHGMTLLAWELSIVTCCPIHQSYLIDICPHCQKSLAWDRPAIDICACGHFLTLKGNDCQPSDTELSLASHLYRLVEGYRQAPGTELPQWITSLSIDGLTFFIRAFGLCTKENQSFPASKSFCKVKTAYWVELIKRALPRLEALDTKPEAIKPLVYAPLLERFGAIYASPEDLDATQYWLSRVSGRLPSRPSVHTPVQGRLFN